MADTGIRTADGINGCKADESSPKDGYKVLKAFKRLKDCHVPAIGKMSGCLTTESCRPILGTRGRGTLIRSNEFENV